MNNHGAANRATLQELWRRETEEFGPDQFSKEFLDWMEHNVMDYTSQPLTADGILLMRWAFDAAMMEGYREGYQAALPIPYDPPNCIYCGDTMDNCGCGAQCPDDWPEED